MKKPVRVLPAVLLALCAAAQATPLSLLLNGGSITAGDKLFDNWSLVNYEASDGARTFNAANIEVTALNDGGSSPGPGLSFMVSNGELSVDGDGIFAFVDLMFGFKVTALDPTQRITGNSLTMGLASVGSDNLLVGPNDIGSYIHETVGTAALAKDLVSAQAVEFSILDTVTTSVLADSATFAPQSSIWVTKNILAWATALDESAELVSFEQRFVQQTVPEPASYALVGIALAGLLAPGALRRRRDTTTA